MIANYYKLLRKSYANYRGWKTKRKLVLFESDDWGSVRIRNQESYNSLCRVGIDLSKSRYTKFDQLEHPEDLECLFEVLSKHKDSRGNHPVFTTNFLVANPDFVKIREENFQNYHYFDLLQTYESYGTKSEMETKIKTGIDNGLISPQFHGREHLHPLRWLKCLKLSKEEKLAFEHQCVPGIPFSKNAKEYIHYMSACDYIDEEERKVVHDATIDGLNLFEQIFGFRAVSFMPSQSVMGDDLFPTLRENGVLLCKAGARYLPTMISKKQIMKHDFWGFKSKYNIYFSRGNSNFEPNKDNSDWIGTCINEIENAFLFNKPAVISTHRVNYVGGLIQSNRTNSIDKLDQLLKMIVSKFSDVEFVDYNLLCDLISKEQSKEI